MPRLTIRKLFLIACIAGLAAAAVSIGRAENGGTRDNAATTAAYQATPQVCPAAHRTATRMPVYKRYLSHTPVARFTRRNG